MLDFSPLTGFAPPWLRRASRLLSWRRLTPPQLFVVSFGLVILLGTMALRTLPGLYTGEPLSWLDALFTATSAVCVTGLIVVDTATYFTTAGQAVVLLLIQIGGIGMVTFASLIIMMIGGRMALHQEMLTRSVAEVAPRVDYRHLTRNVVRLTLLLELAGAVLLYVCWVPRFGWRGAIWPAVFHSVSAFCNAGFSTFSDSLMGFARAPHVLLVVMTLIVLGGIGFLTLEELGLWHRARRARRSFRLSIHTRLVLATSGLLTLGGWLGLTVFEWRASLADMPVWHRLVNGLFMSITPRTAGFNTIDYATATDSANFLTILLMSIGGSPGSMAGGLKTTTFALLGLLAWCRLRGLEFTTIGGRTVPEATMQRAVGLFVIVFGLLTVAIFLFTTSELPWVSQLSRPSGFLPLMFEATSAFNTVGLSMGTTHDLTGFGKVLTTLLMFLGRVGPLTFCAALAARRQFAARQFRYAHENVAIG